MIRALPPWRRIAGVIVLSLVAATIPGFALTQATWNDEEFAAGEILALECAGSTDLSSRGTARFLTGTLGSGAGNSLDSVVGITGIEVTNDGSTAVAVAGTPGASPAGPSAFTAPLSATAINSAVQLGVSLPLPLNWPTGVYQQYARALDTGHSTAAAGAVSNGGAISVGEPGASTGVGSLRLSDLPNIGTTLGELADVALTVGAVGAVASLDGCAHAWDGTTGPSRDYLVSSLGLTATSPAIDALFGATGSVMNLVQADVSAEFGTPGTSGEAETAISAAGLGALTSAVSTGLLSPTLSAVNSALGLLGVSLSVNGSSPQQQSTTVISVDLAPVTTLLSSTITDGVVSVDLANGTIGVDIAALSGGLNSRPANTQLLTDAEVLDAVNRVTTLIDNQIALIRSALRTALESATVTVSLAVILRAGAADVARVELGYSGTLKQFVDGTVANPLVAVTGPTVTILGSGLVQTTLVNTGLVGLLTTILGTVGSVTAAVLDSAEAEAYVEVLGAQLDTTLGSARALAASAMSVVSPLLQAIGTLLTITLNAQPDQPGGGGWPVAAPQPDEFFVSALHVSAINPTTLLSGVNLWLATASVGANAT